MVCGWAGPRPTGTVPEFLADLGHTLWGDGQQRVAFDLSQQIYTPADTQLVIPRSARSPICRLLLGNFSLISDTDDIQERADPEPRCGRPGVGRGGAAERLSQPDRPGHKPMAGARQIQNTPAIEVLHERTWRLPIGTLGGTGNRCAAVADGRPGRPARLPPDRRDLPDRPGPRTPISACRGCAPA